MDCTPSGGEKRADCVTSLQSKSRSILDVGTSTIITKFARSDNRTLFPTRVVQGIHAKNHWNPHPDPCCCDNPGRRQPWCSSFESPGEIFEGIDGGLGVLADFDDVAVGIADVATPFVAGIVERLGEEVGKSNGKERFFSKTSLRMTGKC